MPKPLTLGEVASRSDDGEGEAVIPYKTKIGARRWSSCMSRFCFSFALGAVPITPNAAHRAVGANKNHSSLEKREWNGGIGVCAAMKAPVGLSSHKAVLRKQDGAAPPRQTWVFAEALAVAPVFLVQRSPAHWLDLPNLVARTEYHSRLVLSTLILRFFSQKRCAAGISAVFLHSAQRKPCALEENPLVFYCFFKWFLLL